MKYLGKTYINDFSYVSELKFNWAFHSLSSILML